MKARGVLLKRLKEQRDRDGQYIDPDGLRFGDEPYPVHRGGDLSRTLGTARVSRNRRGEVVAALDLIDDDVKGQLSAMVSFIPRDLDAGVISASDLLGMSVTMLHADDTQPEIERLD